MNTDKKKRQLGWNFGQLAGGKLGCNLQVRVPAQLAMADMQLATCDCNSFTSVSIRVHPWFNFPKRLI
jgi:hypothetical protein